VSNLKQENPKNLSDNEPWIEINRKPLQINICKGFLLAWRGGRKNFIKIKNNFA
jgi:hypothetical protein